MSGMSILQKKKHAIGILGYYYVFKAGPYSLIRSTVNTFIIRILGFLLVDPDKGVPTGFLAQPKFGQELVRIRR